MLNIKHTQLCYWLCLQFGQSKCPKFELQKGCKCFFAPLLTWNGIEQVASVDFAYVWLRPNQKWAQRWVWVELKRANFVKQAHLTGSKLRLPSYLCSFVEFECRITCFLNSSWTLSLFCHASNTTAQWHVLSCMTPGANLTFNGFTLKHWRSCSGHGILLSSLGTCRPTSKHSEAWGEASMRPNAATSCS